MQPFRRPDPELIYDLAKEKNAIDDWYDHRNVPVSNSNNLLIASWNIANLGVQNRTEKDLKLIGHIISRFDLIAVQEINDNLSNFIKLVKYIGDHFDYMINDTAGNNERLGFIYNKKKVNVGRLFAEIAIPKKNHPRYTVVVPYRRGGENRVEVYYKHEFIPFDRNPFVGNFECKSLNFTIVNTHLYFGAFKNSTTINERAKYARRVLEIITLSKWAKKRIKKQTTYDKDILLIGDMNIPAMDKNDSAYKALLKSGLKPLDYFSKTGGSNILNTKTYDQMAIPTGDIKKKLLFQQLNS